jgi:nucleotide-binding universal stress UspA family protein
MKILVPVDGSPFTKRMLAYLAAHDEWLGDAHQYTLLHVVPPCRRAPRRPRQALLQELLRPTRARRSSSRSAPSSRSRRSVPTFVAKVGPAADTIAALAAKGKFDLLMMGSHGHGTAGPTWCMGSVTTKVMAQVRGAGADRALSVR